MGLIAAVLACGAGAILVAVWATWQLVAAMREAQADAARARLAGILSMFAPGVAAAADDPRALLVWSPLAQTARGLFPAEFTTLDAAAGRTFPFSVEQIEAAHATWTAGWLAWEQTHDAECKLKAQTLSETLGPEAGSALGRAKLAAVEREKIERYQQRYAEYTRVAKALQRLKPGP